MAMGVTPTTAPDLRRRISEGLHLLGPGIRIAISGGSALSDKGKPVVRLGRKATGLEVVSR